MRAAAALLSTARSESDLSGLVTTLGIAGESFELDANDVAGLQLESVSTTRLAAGTGSIRALITRLDASARLRNWLPQAARSLSAQAPHVLWIVVAIDAAGENAAIVAWTNGGRGPRLASLMWEPAHVAASDAETLCALAAVSSADDVSRHADIVRVLGRESLTRRFYRVLETQVRTLAGDVRGDEETRRHIALLYASRLLFVSFLEAKGWMDGDRAFIASRFDDCMRRGGGFHQRVLRPLFFGTLNTPLGRRAAAARRFGRVPFLNGGLFTRAAVERRAQRWTFADETLGGLLDAVFQRFRFVAREDSDSWSDASVDPEMLGRAFECLMEPGERRSAGVFYTPHALVARVAEGALEPVTSNAPLSELKELRVLDPACGSGAFLVYALEHVSRLRRARGDSDGSADIRRDVLARCIFGVDRDATAVWICELRLWLSVVIDCDVGDPLRVPPLPNLDRNIRVGDSLVGPGFERGTLTMLGGHRAHVLRERYVRATGRHKASLSRALDREERRRVVAALEREITAARFARAELLGAMGARDLFGARPGSNQESKRASRLLRDRLRALRRELARTRDGGSLPFSFAAFFADAQSRGGFDVVLGNPPWVRLQRIPGALRQTLRRIYEVYRSAPWAAGAADAGVAKGFAGQVDLAALFVERSISLLRDGGVTALLLPVKLWRSLAGGGLRRFVLARTDVLRLEDLSASKRSFDAAVYPSLLVARARTEPPRDAAVCVALETPQGMSEWSVMRSRLAYDESPGAPWLVLRDHERDAFERFRGVGPRLAESAFGPPRLGVKSGCNAAFVVRVVDCDARFATVEDADGERGSIEREVLRPALRGDGVVRWHREATQEWLIWTHDATGAPVAKLAERTRAWLLRRYGALTARSDARGKRWWSLFRVDAAQNIGPRVVWADIGRNPRALVLPRHDPAVPLNSCYVVRCSDDCDAAALTTILNSRLAAAWLNALAEPARGSYRRYLGWTVGQLPLPRDWLRARLVLAEAFGGDDTAVSAAMLDAYRLRADAVAALASVLR